MIIPSPVEDARGRAAKIRRTLGELVDRRDDVLELITAARDAGDADALGYPSWTAYVSGEFGGLLPRLQAEERRPLVSRMRALGMSTRAIAPIVGVHKDTVRNDLAGGESSPPAPAPSSVTGRDGKSYQPRPPSPAAAEHERRRAAWSPFRALMSKTVATLIDQVDDLIDGNDWTDLEAVHAHHGIDGRAVVLARVHALHATTEQLITAWDTDAPPTLRRIK